MPEDSLCADEGQECIDVGCCDGLTCDGESSTCLPDDQECVGDGEGCAEVPCCDGYICEGEGSTCVPGGPKPD